MALFRQKDRHRVPSLLPLSHASRRKGTEETNWELISNVTSAGTSGTGTIIRITDCKRFKKLLQTDTNHPDSQIPSQVAKLKDRCSCFAHTNPIKEALKHNGPEVCEGSKSVLCSPFLCAFPCLQALSSPTLRIHVLQGKGKRVGGGLQGPLR